MAWIDPVIKNRLADWLVKKLQPYITQRIVSNAPWHPMTNPVDIKHLGKLGEELNELGKEINRCLIQGMDEINPETGLTNRVHLEREMADVEANMMLNEEHFNLKIDGSRIEEKVQKLRAWHRGA